MNITEIIESPSRGFTLTEILVVMGILGVIMGALLVSFLIGQQSFRSAGAYVHVQNQARQALDNMKELREAGGTTIGPPDADTQTFQFQLALGYNLTTVVNCPAVGICWGAEDQQGTKQATWYVRYRVATPPETPTNQLLREVCQPGPPDDCSKWTRVLAQDIDPTLPDIFHYDSALKKVRIHLQILQSSAMLPGGRMASQPLVAQIQLRNTGS